MVICPNSRAGSAAGQPAMTDGAYVVHSSDAGRTELHKSLTGIEAPRCTATSDSRWPPTSRSTSAIHRVLGNAEATRTPMGRSGIHAEGYRHLGYLQLQLSRIDHGDEHLGAWRVQRQSADVSVKPNHSIERTWSLLRFY